MSSTAGNATTTTLPTTNGQFVRLLGYKIATNIVFFNPSNDYIEL